MILCTLAGYQNCTLNSSVLVETAEPKSSFKIKLTLQNRSIGGGCPGDAIQAAVPSQCHDLVGFCFPDGAEFLGVLFCYTLYPVGMDFQPHEFPTGIFAENKIGLINALNIGTWLQDWKAALRYAGQSFATSGDHII